MTEIGRTQSEDRTTSPRDRDIPTSKNQQSLFDNRCNQELPQLNHPKPTATFPASTASAPRRSKHAEPFIVSCATHRSTKSLTTIRTPLHRAVRNSCPGRIGNALRQTKEFDLVFLREGGQFELNEPYSAGAWVRTEITGENQTIMGISGELGSAWRGWDLFLDSENRPSIRLISYWPHNYMQITAECYHRQRRMASRTVHL